MSHSRTDQSDTAPAETGMGASPSIPENVWAILARRASDARHVPAPLAPAVWWRFADLTSPATAAAFFIAPEEAAGAVRQAQLHNRFLRLAGLKMVARLRDEGLDPILLKGAAAAYRLYAAPDDRGLSDVDILIDRDCLSRTIAVLREEGLEFREPQSRARWGFVSDASFQPVLDSAEATNVDLHVLPDAWPVRHGLSTRAVLDAAVELSTEVGPVRAPHASHALLLAATHGARDLMGAASTKGMLDTLLLLAGRAGPVDGDEILWRARRGGFLPPLRAWLSLAGRLGAPLEALPAALTTAPAGRELERAVQEFETLFPDDPGLWARLRREICLSAGPRIAGYRNVRRLVGLIAPNQGIPE